MIKNLVTGKISKYKELSEKYKKITAEEKKLTDFKKQVAQTGASFLNLS